MDIEKLPEKITRNILVFSNIVLKLHVRLKSTDSKTTYHNEFEYTNKKYLSINPTVYLTLDMVKDKDGIYDKTRSFVLGQGNIGSVLKTMETVLQDIYNKNIFAIKDNDIIIYADMARKFSKQISIPRMNQSMIIKPAIIYDENEVSYEGVNIFINKTDNVVELTIEEYENLVYAISKIDLFSYSQQLINYFISYYNNKDMNDNMIKGKGDNTTSKRTINWINDNVKSKEKATSTLKPTKDEDDDDIFSQLLTE